MKLNTRMVELTRNSSETSVAHFYAGKSVFITGGSGFLGKVLIEKLLHNCKMLDTIYVLIRRKKDQSPEERIQKLLQHIVFEKLRNEFPGALKKVVPIVGDVSEAKLGLNDNDQKILISKVSVVFHMAATIRFDEPLQTALRINVEGTQDVLDLCHRLKKLDALVHVSTAYSNTDKATVEERVYPPTASLSEVYAFVKEHGGNALKEAEFINGRPNTYTYTKALAEYEVLVRHGDIPTAIVRPSIVTPVMKEPLVGWLDNWYGITATFFGIVSGIIRVLQTDKRLIIDLIPIDIVVNLTIAAATKCRMSKGLTVYNCCSGLQNPLTMGTLLYRSTELAAELNLDARPYPSIFMTESSILIFLIKLFAETLPAYLMDIWLRITGREPKYVKELQKYHKIVKAQTYFTTHAWVFKDDNVRELVRTMSPLEQKVFYCDPAEIEWGPYLANYIIGVYQYLLKKPRMKV